MFGKRWYVQGGGCAFFLSGDRPMLSLPQEKSRFTFLDGKVLDLNKGMPRTLTPVVSDNFASFFKWKGNGEMPADELEAYARNYESGTQRRKAVPLVGSSGYRKL